MCIETVASPLVRPSLPTPGLFPSHSVLPV
jgi:hypothetical protein